MKRPARFSGIAAGRHAKRTEYAGVSYASRMEAAYAAELDRLVAGGAVRFWVPQPTFRLGCAENVYRPDFLVVMLDNIPWREREYVEAHEVKGVETAAFRRNLKLWERYGPCALVVWDGRKVTRRIEPQKNEDDKA